MNACDTVLKSAAELLRRGHLVAFPTETVYGLGADATNPLAVARIFEAKQRPTFDPLIVHVAEFSQVEFVVTNSGAGIAPDHIPHLFDRFWKAAKGSRSGAGLGLFIVKGIVESHGGSVEVKSTPEEGTRFSFRLSGATAPAWRPES